MKLQRVFLNDRPRPNAVHEIVLADEFTRRSNENLEDLECAAPDRDNVALGP
jgi:hypothetical protein